MKAISKHWPILGLLILSILLFVANYIPHTYLVGWDNLLPELAPGINIQRSIFAVWQEYQSLGLLGGMGHASDLIRQIYVLLLSLVFPQNMIRYVSTFTMLFLGGVGAYFLTKHLFYSLKSSVLSLQSYSFVAALFYTLNIATVQTFYAPFEAFSAHFASLPWIFLSVLVFFRKANFKHFSFMLLVFLLSAPSFYIPTIFVVVVMALLIFASVEFLMSHEHKLVVKKAALVFAALFITNAYWIMPFSYFTIKNSHVNIEAKIDQMDTQTIFAQNKEFGTLQDTALLKGFWFNNVDPDVNGNNNFMFVPWRAHFSNPLVPVFGFALFGIILLGAFSSISKIINHKSSIINRKHVAFAALFFFSFSMLAIDAFPFSLLNALLRILPLAAQVFRFPFTKFSILAALTYSIFLALGLSFLIELLSKKILNHKSLIFNLTRYSLFLIPASLIVLLAFPIFTGHLFYNKERTAIPMEYFQTFDFFKKQDPATRIADLPQPTFWGWTEYRFGMGGSGFLWYGIKQPILDRAFDVWSKTSEEYYYELSQALYSKDPQRLQNVFNKYQITWVLLDENVIYPSSPKRLFYDETENLLGLLPMVKPAATFGKIKIYKVDLADKPKSFVFTTNANLPHVDIPFWKTSDPAYQNLGNYISGESQVAIRTSTSDGRQATSYAFPFGGLFSQKEIKGDFKLTKDVDSLSIEKQIDLPENSQLKIPQFFENETITPVAIYKDQDERGDTQLTAVIKTPEIKIDGQKVWGNTLTLALAKLPQTTSYPVTININGTSNITLLSGGGNNSLVGTSFLSRKQDNQIVVSAAGLLASSSVGQTVIEDIYSQEQKIILHAGKHKMTITLPKIDDSYLSFKALGQEAKAEDCNSFRAGVNEISYDAGAINLLNVNDTQCLSFYSSTLFSDQGYAIFVDAKNTQGMPLHFWVLNEDEKYTPLDIYLNNKTNSQSFILPPMQQAGVGYSFHFENSSIGRDTTKNTLSNIEVYPIPYKFLTELFISSGVPNSNTAEPAKIASVSYSNESLYLVRFSRTSPTASTSLILSQSYDPGWKAYRVKNYESRIMNYANLALPFILGSELKQHIEVNGWANGWLLDANSQRSTDYSIIIVYLPQYLEYFGFAILGITFLSVFASVIKKAVVRSR